MSGILRLLQFNEALSSGQLLTTADNIVAEYFGQTGVFHFCMFHLMEYRNKSFELRDALLSRFFKACPASGIDKIKITMDNPREYLNCDQDVIVISTSSQMSFQFGNQSTVQCCGTLRVLFDKNVSRIEYLHFLVRSWIHFINANPVPNTPTIIPFTPSVGFTPQSPITDYFYPLPNPYALPSGGNDGYGGSSSMSDNNAAPGPTNGKKRDNAFESTEQSNYSQWQQQLVPASPAGKDVSVDYHNRSASGNNNGGGGKKLKTGKRMTKKELQERLVQLQQQEQQNMNKSADADNNDSCSETRTVTVRNVQEVSMWGLPDAIMRILEISEVLNTMSDILTATQYLHSEQNMDVSPRDILTTMVAGHCDTSNIATQPQSQQPQFQVNHITSSSPVNSNNSGIPLTPTNPLLDWSIANEFSFT